MYDFLHDHAAHGVAQQMEILNTQLIQCIQNRLSMSYDALWGSQMPGITVSGEVNGNHVKM
jgi:hypothetical protein